MSHTDRVAAITGIAGTGKTTIIRIVHKTLTDAGYYVAVAAPTGKAAKRITEATGIPAMTVHRLLEFPYPNERDPKTGKVLDPSMPQRDRTNPLESDVVVVDEYSMINRELHGYIIDALPSGARLLMFGDANQLQPIERLNIHRKSDSPFQRALKKFEGVVLKHNHRQGAGSGIADNGGRVLIGRVPLRHDDFAIVNTNQPIKSIGQWVESRAHDGVDYTSIDVQIMSVTKKSWIGTYKLNLMMQNMLNPRPKGDMIDLPRNTWDKGLPLQVAVGDKVVWTENAYDLRDVADRNSPPPPSKYIFNGETGKIVLIGDGEIHIDVGDRVVEVPSSQYVERRDGAIVDISPWRRIDLAYVLTTHKAQGSEYTEAVYVLNKSTRFMQCRTNMYTAITRAKILGCVISDVSSLQHSVQHRLSLMDMKDERKK